MKARANARARLDPDASAVALDHLLADRQPDAGSRVLALVVQPLEHHEDALEVLRLDADAVVARREFPFRFSFRNRKVNSRNRSRAEFERIADEVLEELPELHL